MANQKAIDTFVDKEFSILLFHLTIEFILFLKSVYT